MPQAEQFEALILGSGQGGKLLAWHLPQLGRWTDDFRIIWDNLAGGRRSIADRPVPSCMFTEASLVRVESDDRKALRDGIPGHVARLPRSAVPSTASSYETMGFLKVHVSADQDRILGVTMIGNAAGEVMIVVRAAILANLPYPWLRDAVPGACNDGGRLGSLFANVPPL
jgi:pyruvate/2-oxoglutarate dehydrogenase complex dihydrolipoamide dehydrogenase (E3) component